MTGHVRKRGEKWAVFIELGRGPDGKRKQKTIFGFTTKKAATAELNRVLAEMQTGSYIEPSKLRVAEYLQHWLDNHVQRNCSPKTRETYADFVRVHFTPALGHIPLAKLTPLHIENYLTEALKSGRRRGTGGLSPQTVLHHHRALHAALGRAVKLRLIPYNPADAVDTPKVERDERPALTPDEMIRILDAAQGTRLYIPILLILTAGTRRGEILGLRWEDVDLEKGVLHVRQAAHQTRGIGVTFGPPKTKKSKRSIALPPLTVELLRQHHEAQQKEREAGGPYYEHHGLVVQREDGTPWPPNAMSLSFANFLRRQLERELAGLPRVTFHDLRHTFTTAQIGEGVPLKTVSGRLGHSTITLTADRYGHLLPHMQDEAAAAMEATLRRAIERRSVMRLMDEDWDTPD